MKFSIKTSDFKTVPTITLAMLCFTLFATPSYSRPNFTAEQLAKARKAASEAKDPIDFDALMDEADRLGVECEGDLTKYSWIKICKINVKGAQARERTEASKKRQKATREETIRILNEAADEAERKLKKIENR